MEEGILNEESKINQILRKLSIYCIEKMSKLKTNLIDVDFFWKLMNIAMFIASIASTPIRYFT